MEAFSNAAKLCKAIVAHELVDEESIVHVRSLWGAVEPDILPDLPLRQEAMAKVRELVQDPEYVGFLKGPVSKVMSSLEAFSTQKLGQLQKGGDLNKICETVSHCIDGLKSAMEKNVAPSASELTLFRASLVNAFDLLKGDAVSKEFYMVRRLLEAVTLMVSVAKENMLDDLLSDPACRASDKIPKAKKMFTEIYLPIAGAVNFKDCLAILPRELQAALQQPFGELLQNVATVRQVRSYPEPTDSLEVRVVISRNLKCFPTIGVSDFSLVSVTLTCPPRYKKQEAIQQVPTPHIQTKARTQFHFPVASEFLPSQTPYLTSPLPPRVVSCQRSHQNKNL